MSRNTWAVIFLLSLVLTSIATVGNARRAQQAPKPTRSSEFAIAFAPYTQSDRQRIDAFVRAIADTYGEDAECDCGAIGRG